MSFARVCLTLRTLRPVAQGGLDLAGIKLERVSKSFGISGRPLSVLDRVSFDVASGSVVAIVGPNGSGKSTLLRLIAGLLQADSGSITIGKLTVGEADQRVGLVFQEPRLLPWRSVVDNVAFPLELAGVPAAKRRERARALLETVGVSAFANAYPQQLSGGMRQRTAVARALVRDPEVLLLDEPFSALDALTRERFDFELLELWQRIGATVLVVTHSIPEAVILADEVIVLSPRPGHVVARVPVPLARPRSVATFDDPAFTRIAAAVRASLAGTPSDYAAQEAAAAPVRDVLERAGSPAWFDPFGGGA
jgi:NitT/TauT family transport system ATP-binding protein